VAVLQVWLPGIGGVDCGFVFVWLFVSGTFGWFETWMTLSVPAFTMVFCEEMHFRDFWLQ
jgi:hypothetical protein